jgi:hyperosmotically inducible periplasmic protein
MKLSVIALAAMLGAIPASSAFAQSAATAQSRPTDKELSSTIATKIANDNALSADAIKVTVKNGVVTLTGMVGKDEDKAAAEEAARIPGVVRVDNKLASREKATNKTKGTAGTVADTTKKGAEKTADATKKGAEKTKDAAGKTGSVITDGWISTRIKTNFMGEASLRASDIKVDTNSHVVTLSGSVPDEAARTKALTIAKEVEGVRRVVDNLKVVAKD